MLLHSQLLLVTDSCQFNLWCSWMVHIAVEEVSHLLFKRAFNLLEHIVKVLYEDVFHLVFITDPQFVVFFSDCLLNYA